MVFSLISCTPWLNLKRPFDKFFVKSGVFFDSVLSTEQQNINNHAEVITFSF
jgi:hypothetical protein